MTDKATEYVNVSAAFDASLILLRDAMTAKPRGAVTRELIAHNFKIERPHEMFIFSALRFTNPFAQIAETLWVLAGRNDLDWLERYIPQCKKWSDDGKTWRAGYGPRLRNWTYEWNDMTYGIDQIEMVIDALKKDRSTRQAVISLWNPAVDWEPSKDIPCNNWLQFIIRHNYLFMNVTVRSNDLIYGFSHVDFMCWAVLQSFIAHAVDALPGDVSWYAGSFHIYERHFDLLKKQIELTSLPFKRYYDYSLPELDDSYLVPYVMTMGWKSVKDMDVELMSFFECVDYIWNGDVSLANYVPVAYANLKSKFAIMSMHAMYVHREFVKHGRDAARHALNELIPATYDLYHSIIQYMYKDEISEHEFHYTDYVRKLRHYVVSSD